MFRLTQYMDSLIHPSPVPPARKPSGPVVIWNLIRRCNLTCKHCYSISADTHFKGELSTEEVHTVMDDLKAFGVPVLILSGGEPLLRPDIFDIATRAKEMGFYVGLSSNGTLIDESNIERIARTGFDYVGISLDGLREAHDHFRQKQGAFDASLHAARLCKAHGIKVGLRFTLTQLNYQDFPALLDLVAEHDIDKFYLSHLNYAGRGRRNSKHDAHMAMTRDAMNQLFARCESELKSGVRRDYVTGNNDADAVWLIKWAEAHYPDQVPALTQRLKNWGGNATGEHIANIDNLGNVHPDTFWWDYSLGNVRETPFSEIWRDTQDPLIAGLRQRPRPVEGRCRVCPYLAVCNGNTRVRARQTYNNPWAEDPACYLTDAELGIQTQPDAVNFA
ncbi:MAG: heme d1 biosynthesis radical SAM protein NirJ [Gammaproteobacteria bacterium]|nr:MAG: heme d1 biosynthesis radical SAM protein NirJ [Gammaproteobacteria bacterium]